VLKAIIHNILGPNIILQLLPRQTHKCDQSFGQICSINKLEYFIERCFFFLLFLNINNKKINLITLYICVVNNNSTTILK
jgi:hypothetical protein